jgi:PAS domain S-box-containing protein
MIHVHAYIVEMAKRRLDTTAKLIGSMVEAKQAEEAIRASEEKHRRLFETMNQGVTYQAADGTIISANPAAERILGLAFDQMRGKTSMDPRWRMIQEDGTANSRRRSSVHGRPAHRRDYRASCPWRVSSGQERLHLVVHHGHSPVSTR